MADPPRVPGDFEEAIDRVLAGLRRKRVMSQREREIVAAHEAGHAIVASVLPGVDPVHKISRQLLDREVVEGDEIRRLVSIGSNEGAHAA